VDSATIAHFVRLATRHAAALEAANLTHITMSSMFPEMHCAGLAKFLAGHAYPPAYYHFLEQWRAGHHYVFVSPARSRMAAHIDIGGSYFFLRVHRGRKVVRLWPIYSRTSPLGLPPPQAGAGELEAWLLAQRDAWPASVDPLLHFRGCFDPAEARHPCEPFLPDKWQPLGKATNIAANTLQAEVPAGATEQQGRRLGHGADAHACFVEVDLGPGDELFVPSDTPHQVTTVEPTLSSSLNFFPE